MGVTIKDIAEKANVSITTVSRVLNNKPDVSKETKKKILHIINKVGYNPNGIARGLVLQRTYTIGLMIPDISNPFFPEVARGIESQAKELGYSIIFCNTHNDKQGEKEAIELLKGKQVDGIILSLSMQNRDELEKLKEEKFAVVQIDRKIPGSRFPTVIVDNVSSAYRATQYLINRGHKQIAHITGDLGTKTGEDRLRGFRQALSEYGIDCQEDWILEGDYSKESGYDQMKYLLEQAEKPQAVFAANDLMAVGCYEAVFDHGLNIPDDISIIGHDNIDVTSFVRPGLTTMNQPKHELGEKAVTNLVDQIENKDTHEGQDIILDTDLVVRDSVAERL